MSDCLREPLVTIYLPTFNRVSLLMRAVNSVLNQTYKNIELIVVDDLSKDSTLEYLGEISKKYSNIRWFVNDHNSGACVSRNRAIKEARGVFVTGLDDDDYLCKDHIETLWNAWQVKDCDTIAIYPNFSRDFGSNVKKASKRLQICSAKDLICSNWIGNQVFTQIDVLRNIGGFDEALPAWQDYECWFRLLTKTGKKAVCSGKYTYVQDVSHSHERISTSGSDKILRAWEIYSEKHRLNQVDREIVKLMLVSYSFYDVNLRYLVHKTLRMPKFKNLRHSFIIIFKYLRFM